MLKWKSGRTVLMELEYIVETFSIVANIEKIVESRLM